MARRNDQVFQLTLTEIAFTISFLLLLLLAFVVLREQRARQAAEASLARLTGTTQADADPAAIRREIERERAAAGPAADEQTLAALVEARVERARLRRAVAALDTRLSALAEVQKALAGTSAASAGAQAEVDAALALQGRVREALDGDDGAGGGGAPGGSASAPGHAPRSAAEERERVAQALDATRALRRQARARLGHDVVPGHEAEAVDALAGAASGPSTDTADLRGQVAFLRERLGARGGRDFPPCWADDAGKVEFLFAIELTPAGMIVSPAWPPRRDAAAHALPGLQEIVGGPWPAAEFVLRTRALLDDSRRRVPECRHYVELRSSIADAVQSDRARLVVEGVFYKSEVRR